MVQLCHSPKVANSYWRWTWICCSLIYKKAQLTTEMHKTHCRCMTITVCTQSQRHACTFFLSNLQRHACAWFCFMNLNDCEIWHVTCTSLICTRTINIDQWPWTSYFHTSMKPAPPLFTSVNETQAKEVLFHQLHQWGSPTADQLSLKIPCNHGRR